MIASWYSRLYRFRRRRTSPKSIWFSASVSLRMLTPSTTRVFCHAASVASSSRHAAMMLL
jgi:hypothetical protein